MIITVCGSIKFMGAMREAEKKLTDPDGIPLEVYAD